MLAIVNCQHFPCQNSEIIDSPKFSPAKIFCYTVSWELLKQTLVCKNGGYKLNIIAYFITVHIRTLAAMHVATYLDTNLFHLRTYIHSYIARKLVTVIATLLESHTAR